MVSWSYGEMLSSMLDTDFVCEAALYMVVNKQMRDAAQNHSILFGACMKYS